MIHSFMTRLLQASPVVAAAACAGSFAAGGAEVTASPPGPEVALVADIPPHDGRYRASLAPAGKSAWDGSEGWMISLRDANGEPVNGAAIAMEAWQPEGAHSAPGRSAARALGAGRYRMDGVALASTGWWNLKLAIGGVAADSLAFNLVLR